MYAGIFLFLSMKVTVQIHYRTRWGEHLSLSFGKKNILMSFKDGFMWEAVFISNPRQNKIYYSLKLEKEGKVIRREEGKRLPIEFSKDVKSVLILDNWRDGSWTPFCSKLFKHVMFPHTIENSPIVQKGETFIETFAPCIPSSKRVSICGSSRSLGEWNTSKAIDMAFIGDGLWAVTLKKEQFPVEFKHIIRPSDEQMWEEGSNRYVPVNDEDCVIIRAGKFRSVAWKAAGVAIPVFSLRSARSFGIGEFEDIKSLAYFSRAAGMKIIQILPINDTIASRTFRDSYPYSSISSFALNPIYISLDSILDTGIWKHYSELRTELNSLTAVDFEKVLRYKEKFLRKAFSLTREKINKDGEYLHFISQNQIWLYPYASFCTLRDVFKTTDFSKWEQYRVYNSKIPSLVEEKYGDDFQFHLFVQFHLHRQLMDAVEYCHRLHIAVKGDLPIGVGRHSADVWSNPTQFDCQSCAGAPPDDFSKDGQNWGFPIYNWEEMKKDGYSWWKNRLSKMAEYFDAYRIDHILGFFRIWEVPLEAKSALMGEFFPSIPLSASEIRKTGFKEGISASEDYLSTNTLWLRYRHSLKGYVPRINPFDEESFKSLSPSQQEAYRKIYDDFFYARHNRFWDETAEERLGALSQENEMLTCGEDLGMIPLCVPEFMRRHNILSLEIERMPKAAFTDFGDLRSYPYLSVCTTSTHDMSPLREWWKEDRNKTEKYFREVLNMHGEIPENVTEQIAATIIRNHLLSSSMLAIIPLQDWMSIDKKVRLKDGISERINIPAVSDHYWRYRMHLSLEELLQKKGFIKKIRHLIEESGR